MGRKKVVTLYNGRYRGNLLTEEACDRLDMIRDAFDNGSYFEDLKKYLYDLDQTQIDDVLDARQSLEEGERPHGELSESQTVSVAFGVTAEKWLCGDSVGLGKTAVGAGIYNYLKRNRDANLRMLFLAPDENIMKQNLRQLVRFTGEYFMPSTGRRADAMGIVKYYEETGQFPNVVGMHSLAKQAVFLELVADYTRTTGERPYDVVIVDESACLSNTKTQLYNKMVEVFGDARYKICFNGTEFDTSLQEFYSQLNFLDPTLLPTKTNFQKEYCVLEYGHFSGYLQPSGKYKNAEEFRHRVGYRYFARTRRALGADMRNCTAEIVPVKANDYQKNLLKSSSMPSLVLNCPWAIDMSIDPDYDTCPKLKSLWDILHTKLGYNDPTRPVPEQVLIYVNHKAAQQGIADMLDGNASYKILNGDTPSEDREEIVKGFSSGYYQILITNVQKGLNFQNCDNVIFFEFPSVGRAIQVEGRMTRSENIENKHVFVLLYDKNETPAFKGILSDRGKALDTFASTDYSMVLNLLLEQQSKG